jgi:hypothetical protein
VAGGFREVEAHEGDEGVNILDGHGLHVAELRSRGVDRSDVGKSRSHGVILETETRLEASQRVVRGSGTSKMSCCLDVEPASQRPGRRSSADLIAAP